MRMNRLVYSFLVILLATSGCLAKGKHIHDAPGTISGSVRAPGAENVAANREVIAIDVTTGGRYPAHTNAVGDYTIQVPPGKYRVELTLRAGEALSKKPDELDVHSGGVKADVNLVIAAPK